MRGSRVFWLMLLCFLLSASLTASQVSAQGDPTETPTPTPTPSPVPTPLPYIAYTYDADAAAVPQITGAEPGALFNAVWPVAALAAAISIAFLFLSLVISFVKGTQL